jgi:lysophospholipase L1-like esterase
VSWRWAAPAFAPVVLATLSTVALAVGLALALSDHYGQSVREVTEPSAARVSAGEAGTGVYRLVALGDSLTAGNGDARAGGYPGRLQKLLEARGWRTSLVNLAVPGAESGEVLARLSEPEVRASVAAASLLLVSAGGNDLSHTLRPVSGRAVAEPEPARASARANLATLVRELRRLSPTAAIRLIGIYNPFEVAPTEEPAARALLASWNAVLEAAADTDSGAVLVPTADLFQGHPERLASDAYHPGPEGHALIADRILQTLPTARPSHYPKE